MRKETLPIVAALDIGTTKICAVVARKNQLGKLEILGMGQADSQGVMRGVISNIDKTVEAIKLAVAEASKKSGIKIHHVYVGVAGQHVKYLRHRGYLMRDHVHDEITQADVDKLISDMHRLALPPGERIIHVLPQEFIIDDEQGIKEPIGMSGVRLEADFHIITGQIAAMQNIHRCVEKAGLKAVELMLEPIASAAAVLNEEEKEAGVALVDIGGGTTDIVIFQEGIIRHTAVIPLGGNIITEDIKEGCMVMREQAEKLKVKFGKALAIEAQENAIVSIPGLRGRAPKEISVKNLAHIIQARMEEILEHVYFQIRLSGYENKLIGGIVVTGGGARLQDLQYLAEYLTGLDARIGLPAEQLSVNSQRSEFNDPMYATAIGLLVKAMERNPIPAEEPEPEPAALPAEPVFEAIPPPIAQEETEEAQPAESTGQSGSWLKNFLRRSREWLEGDIKDFQ
ncbi:cell division protein FtsA [Sphingobacteriales bacterium UPWRP_1]|nr:cell division protein FtsA [Sphingobacteriales bacterium TSM_CSM]PSJ78200.1 cell division protein FtsA [Sphingobacteriales bacterium UPWRP_1]